MSYDAFQTWAFIKYGIPNEILTKVRPWVEKECPDQFNHHSDDLGYAELHSIDRLDQAMLTLRQDLDWQQVEGRRAYKKYIRDAGGRVGKGFYRWTLKAYYLYKGTL